MLVGAYYNVQTDDDDWPTGCTAEVQTWLREQVRALMKERTVLTVEAAYNKLKMERRRPPEAWRKRQDLTEQDRKTAAQLGWAIEEWHQCRDLAWKHACIARALRSVGYMEMYGPPALEYGCDLQTVRDALKMATALTEAPTTATEKRAHKLMREALAEIERLGEVP